MLKPASVIALISGILIVLAYIYETNLLLLFLGFFSAIILAVSLVEFVLFIKGKAGTIFEENWKTIWR